MTILRTSPRAVSVLQAAPLALVRRALPALRLVLVVLASLHSGEVGRARGGGCFGRI